MALVRQPVNVCSPHVANQPSVAGTAHLNERLSNGGEPTPDRRRRHAEALGCLPKGDELFVGPGNRGAPTASPRAYSLTVDPSIEVRGGHAHGVVLASQRTDGINLALTQSRIVLGAMPSLSATSEMVRSCSSCATGAP
jgi:hypothetical protein